MVHPPKLFLSSGDLIADRRYQYARELAARGDLHAAADLLKQAVELAPGFASAWFMLGEVHERRGEHAAAVAAFIRALDADADDRHGAKLRLARLGEGRMADAMSPGYVRALFDQYAPDFDGALRDRLDYRGPELLRAALARVTAAQGRPLHLDRVIDLGCGTGLMGEALGAVGSLVGVDLSPRMIEAAARKSIYAELVVADMLTFLRDQAGTADLIVAADAFVYLADLAPICCEAARVLVPGGLFAFTLETHPGDGVVLGAKLRFAHGEGHVRKALASAGLPLRECSEVLTRTEGGIPVPGLLVVAERP